MTGKNVVLLILCFFITLSFPIVHSLGSDFNLIKSSLITIKFYDCKNKQPKLNLYKLKEIDNLFEEDYFFSNYTDPFWANEHSGISDRFGVRKRLLIDNMTIFIAYKEDYFFLSYELDASHQPPLGKSYHLDNNMERILNKLNCSAPNFVIIWNIFNYDGNIDCDPEGKNPYLCSNDEEYLNLTSRFDFYQVDADRIHYKDDEYFIFDKSYLSGDFRNFGRIIVFSKDNLFESGVIRHPLDELMEVLTRLNEVNYGLEKLYVMHSEMVVKEDEIFEELSGLRAGFTPNPFYIFNNKNLRKTNSLTHEINEKTGYLTDMKSRKTALESDLLKNKFYSDYYNGLISEAKLRLKNEIDEIENIKLRIFDNINDFENLDVQRKSLSLAMGSIIAAIIISGAIWGLTRWSNNKDRRRKEKNFVIASLTELDSLSDYSRQYKEVFLRRVITAYWFDGEFEKKMKRFTEKLNIQSVALKNLTKIKDQDVVKEAENILEHLEKKQNFQPFHMNINFFFQNPTSRLTELIFQRSHTIMQHELRKEILSTILNNLNINKKEDSDIPKEVLHLIKMVDLINEGINYVKTRDPIRRVKEYRTRYLQIFFNLKELDETITKFAQLLIKKYKMEGYVKSELSKKKESQLYIHIRKVKYL